MQYFLFWSKTLGTVRVTGKRTVCWRWHVEEKEKMTRAHLWKVSTPPLVIINLEKSQCVCVCARGHTLWPLSDINHSLSEPAASPGILFPPWGWRGGGGGGKPSSHLLHSQQLVASAVTSYLRNTSWFFKMVLGLQNLQFPYVRVYPSTE